MQVWIHWTKEIESPVLDKLLVYMPKVSIKQNPSTLLHYPHGTVQRSEHGACFSLTEIPFCTTHISTPNRVLLYVCTSRTETDGQG